MKRDFSLFTPPTTKQDFRRELKQRLLAKTEKERLIHSLHLCSHAAHLPAFIKAQTIAFFASLPTEPDLTVLIEEAWAHGKQVVLPRIVPATPTAPFQNLEWRVVQDWTDLISTPPRDLREPNPDLCPVITLDKLDCAFIPGLGFDASGGRLGRGGGFYDRFLASAPATLPCPGLMFSYQKVDRLPLEPHDQRLLSVVTETSLEIFPKLD